jgi:hypothetical protein
MNGKIFAEGDEVQWTSQSAGSTTTKIGHIVQVIPPGTRPSLKGAGMQRDHESYLVRAKVEGSSRFRMYWPKVRYLSLVTR